MNTCVQCICYMFYSVCFNYYVKIFMIYIFAFVMFLLFLAETRVRFTYSVQFKPSDIAWASRWDTYLKMSDVQIHWFSICNSIAIVLFLSGMWYQDVHVTTAVGIHNLQQLLIFCILYTFLKMIVGCLTIYIQQQPGACFGRNC